MTIGLDGSDWNVAHPLMSVDSIMAADKAITGKCIIYLSITKLICRQQGYLERIQQVALTETILSSPYDLALNKCDDVV